MEKKPTKEALVQQIRTNAEHQSKNRGARAELDVLLVEDITASIGSLISSINKSSTSNDIHAKWMKWLTIVLALATIIQAAAAVIPFFKK